MKYILGLMAASLIFLSCKKTNNDELWECNNVQSLDSAGISNKIVGSWVWTKQACGDLKYNIREADKSIKVNFNASAGFSVLENSVTITQGNWKLKIVDSNSWDLDLTSSSEYLYGRILFCNNKIMFANRYLDGCDNVFVKE